jgi:hypothetical protein
VGGDQSLAAGASAVPGAALTPAGPPIVVRAARSGAAVILLVLLVLVFLAVHGRVDGGDAKLRGVGEADQQGRFR